MSNRAAKFASAVFAAVLASFSVTVVLHNAADAAEGCQTAPGDQTPDGKHWYYRVEHPGNRQCWYLRDVGDRSAPAALTQRSEQPVEPRAEAPAPQHSLADAHAEYPWPQPRIGQNTAASAPQGMQAPQAMQAPPANAASGQSPNVLQNTTRGSLIGTRWPDPSAPNSTLSPQAASSETVGDAQPDQSTPAQPNASVPLATADAAPAKATASFKATASLQTLLMVIAGALALAGLIGSAIVRLAARRSAPSAVRGHRRVVWEAADGARQSPPPPQPRPSPSRQSLPKVPPWIDSEQSARRPDLAPGFYGANNQNERLDKISELLQRMSRQPATSVAGSASREQTPTSRPDVRA